MTLPPPPPPPSLSPSRQQPTRMALESEEDKCMYAFGAALATQTDQFRKVKHSVFGTVPRDLVGWDTQVEGYKRRLFMTADGLQSWVLLCMGRVRHARSTERIKQHVYRVALPRRTGSVPMHDEGRRAALDMKR